jgi:ribosomal protein S6--L-glutamate ligase
MLVHSAVSMGSVFDAIRGLDQDVLIQQFLSEGAGRDYRAFVVGNRVVGAMMRTAPKGEFRSNVHRGGATTLVKLSRPYRQAAIKAARTLGLGIAGVDLMECSQGPMIIEVNSSPGFEGIEAATKLNIAQEIVRHMVREGRKAARKKRR